MSEFMAKRHSCGFPETHKMQRKHVAFISREARRHVYFDRIDQNLLRRREYRVGLRRISP